MKEELIKYVMAEADKCYADDFPIREIEYWIREFFDHYQPERLSERDYREICIDHLRGILDPNDLEKLYSLVCDSPNTPTKGSESTRNE